MEWGAWCQIQGPLHREDYPMNASAHWGLGNQPLQPSHMTDEEPGDPERVSD